MQANNGGNGNGGSNNDLGSSGSEVDLRSSNDSTNYLTPAHYSGYNDENPSEYPGLGYEHHTTGHPYGLDGSPEFYGQAAGMQLEHKYQPPNFKNYPRSGGGGE